MGDTNELYSVKMRASRRAGGADEHISGAEKLVGEDRLRECVDALVARAIAHDKGRADDIGIKIHRVDANAVRYLDALETRSVEVDCPADGAEVVKAALRDIGVTRADEIVDLLQTALPTRGAALVDIHTLERLEPDKERGVRATNMDRQRDAREPFPDGKEHYEEAVVLATKVAHCPGVVAEICVSDDPDYTTGYVASKELGYIRISPLKYAGTPRGGRVFLFDSRNYELEKAVEYLQNEYVVVRNVRPLTPTAPRVDRDRLAFLNTELRKLDAANLRRKITTFESAQSARVRVDGRDVILLASNNYLDIAAHDRLKTAAVHAVQRYGCGSGGSRLTTGTCPAHLALERKIAQFKHAERAIVFNTGYAANLATIAALVGPGDAVFSDALNHASVIDGCRASKARVVVYKHNDMADLERKLASTPRRRALVVSDAVFSMDGDIVDCPRFLDVCERYGAISMLDEAHAVGTLGSTGRGVAEHYALRREPDVMMGTLSKAFGSEGGYVAGKAELIEYLQNKARAFVFSTAFSPVAAACALAGIELVEDEPQRVRRLQANARYFRDRLNAYGVECDATNCSPIIPVVVGDEARAVRVARSMFQAGYYVSAIRYPTVAQGAARIRVAVMATHEQRELDAAAALLARLVDARPQA